MRAFSLSKYHIVQCKLHQSNARYEKCIHYDQTKRINTKHHYTYECIDP